MAANLHPSGFLETLDECSGPTLYKSTPSRESYAPTLNDFMEKYVSGEYTDQTLIKTLETLKRFSQNWPKLTKNVQRETLKIILEGNGEMSEALKLQIDKNHKKQKLEEIPLEKELSLSQNPDEAIKKINNYLENLQKTTNGKVLNEVRCVRSNNQNSIFILLMVIIISLVIGFYCAQKIKK